ncbi:hypothetical protein SADUNF_Sadunf09G0136400 [Salix dunnii]|uniref:Uncharacterized protein n=1 Tax=Salix dunnii TaxID=1413687 RepID=A0A835MRP2_9ROSI|nr:hypothetical protein SADUNF_Sadunf09G0136400 [Salix dunnii]
MNHHKKPSKPHQKKLQPQGTSWADRGLSLVASKVGKPLSCDESTYTCSRLDFARVCVEIDAGMPFIHNFEIITPLSPEPLHI